MRKRFVSAVMLAALFVPSLFAADSAPGRNVVSVDGQPVTQSEVFDAAVQYYPQQMQALVSRLVDRRLITNEARLRNVKISTEEVRRRAAASGITGDLSPAAAADIEALLLAEKLVQQKTKIAVSDAEVREFFEAHRQQLGQPSRVHLRHIVAASQREADDLLFALRAGADFAIMAKAKSTNRATGERGGDIGPLSPDQLAPEIRRVVGSLPDGGISAVVPLSDGFHIFKVEKNVPARLAVLDAAMKATLRDTVRAQKTDAQVALLLEALRKKAVIK